MLSGGGCVDACSVLTCGLQTWRLQCPAERSVEGKAMTPGDVFVHKVYHPLPPSVAL